jgi:hypothetical protein
MALLLGNLLQAVGLGGGVIIAVTVLLSLWHLRSAGKTASTAMSSLWVGIWAVAILFIASLFVPGLELDVALDQLAGFLWSLVTTVLSLVEELL